MLPVQGGPCLGHQTQTLPGGWHLGDSSHTPWHSLEAIIGLFEALLPSGTDGLLDVHDKLLLTTTCPNRYSQLNLSRERELYCGGARLDSLLKLVLLWDVGNQWLVTVTFTFTFLGLEAFRNSLGEGHLVECLSQLGSNLRSLKKLWVPLEKGASSSSLGIGGLVDLAIVVVVTMLQSVECKNATIVLGHLLKESHTIHIGQYC